MGIRHLVLLCLSLFFLGASCEEDTSRPEPPSILRDVAMTRLTADGSGSEFTYPHVPSLRTTHDGRVGIEVEPTDLRVRLMVPEKLGGAIVDGDAGTPVLSATEPYDGGIPFRPNGQGIGHHALCEVAPRFLGPGERANPYACGEGGASDCYDFTHISFTGQLAPGENGRLWGTPMHVEVAEPKTASARIVNVELGEPVGVELPGPVWFEPMVTSDGRLLTGRRLAPELPPTHTWTHPETGERFTRLYDIMYAMATEPAAPCDVRSWSRFHPASHMPHDPELIGRYGVAAFPFRDGEGREIPDGEEIGGTYPWLDREGDNLFMTTIDTRLTEMPEEMYPRRCAMDGCEEAFPEDFGSWTRGQAVLGLWTRGKMVLLDSLINNTDWGFGVSPGAHRLVTLYDEPDGTPVEVRVGSGRTAGWTGPIAPPSGYSGNASVFDSVEHLWNAHEHLKPVTPADIVWVVSNGAGTDELPFDDYLDPDAFIISSMQGAVRWVPQRFRALEYQHGYDPVRRVFDRDVHLQNAATAPPERWRVPAYGRVEVGTGRLEFVALGGVTGKGFWLDGDDRISYAIEEQPADPSSRDWSISIFLDARARDGETRTVLSFPDGSSLALRGRDTLLLRSAEATEASYDLSALWPDTGWVHVGLELRDGGTRVLLAVNGYPAREWSGSTPLFQLPPGELVVGQAGDPGKPGFRGWIDELELFARRQDPELACNLAHGTLVRVTGNAEWAAVAARYPAWAHDAVASAAGFAPGGGERFACYTDLTGDHAAHLGNLPAGTQGVRARVHFPEGPLVSGEARPESRDNFFCRTCHHAGQPFGLSPAALALDPTTTVEDDPRRQPTQPPARVHGHVPADWIAPAHGPGGPAADLVTPNEGTPVDPWVLPGG